MVAGIITFYWTVVFVHVLAVVAGFGPTFVYPLLLRAARNRYPRSLPYTLRTMEKIGKAVIAPAAFLILLTGVYLISEGPYEFGANFVQAPFTILIVLIPLVPLYFGRTETKLAGLAERDIAASGHGDVTLSPEFDSLLRQLKIVIRLANVAILVALFFMIVKP